MRLRSSFAVFLLLALEAVGQALASASVPAGPASQTAPLEQGKFRLHKFEQAIGEESYQIQQIGANQVLISDFKFKDRFTEVPLTTRLEFASDLTPHKLEIKGKTARSVAIDDMLTVQGDKIQIREGRAERDESRPERYFLIAGYAPTAVQMMLMRYWLSHGSPATLKTFPSGEVRIQDRGSDEVQIDGHSRRLERYSVSGLIWGRETLWLDPEKNLAAVVTTDAEFDHFEAVRGGFEPALPTLVARAGSDEMAALAEISKHFHGRNPGKLAFKGATLIDGTGGAPIPNAVVVVDGDRIVAAGPAKRVRIPHHVTVVDAKGKTILPGLWDMHAHFEQVEWGPIYLAAGVTSVRDCGNEFEFITAVRDALRDGHGLGPRLLLAGVVDGSGPAAIGVQRVDNPQQAEQWVQRYHDAGFQQVKIYSSMTRDNVAAVAVAAHRLGMTVTGHIPEGMTGFQGVEAGMDQINHIQFIADMLQPVAKSTDKTTRLQRLQAVAAVDLNAETSHKAIAFLKAHGTVVDPTMALMEVYAASPDHPVESFEPGVKKVAPELAAEFVENAQSPEVVEASRRAFAKLLEIVGALHLAGVPVVAGTDQAVPGHSLHREIELYVEAGMTPLEAIQAATIVPARVMGLDNELGTIEVGKKADLIVLGANPLDSIHNLRKVEKVVSGGILYDPAPLWESVGFQP
ncbi:MAG TPA: amidohydrolase family protein [Terriglobales bacterium]|jgi:imidazolonepropionase-like amidohydrolase|nr:amidohydrolase family protein [Terriglobales bacterium]